MQNVVPVIQPAAPVDSIVSQAQPASGQSLADLFAQVLQQFQANSGVPHTPLSEASPTETPQTTGESPPAIPIAETVEGEAIPKASVESMVELLSVLDLPESVDLEHILSVVETAFGSGNSDQAETKLAALQGQGIPAEVVAKLQQVVVSKAVPIAQGGIAQATPTPPETTGTSGTPVTTHATGQSETTPIVSEAPAKTVVATGGASTTVPTSTTPVESVEQTAAPVVTEEEPSQASAVRPETTERVLRAKAPEVLARLREAGVPGITDEKVARVSDAVQKSLNPEVAVTTADAKPKETPLGFAPPKVTPLTPQATTSTSEVVAGNAPVESEEGEGIKPVSFAERWVPAKENVNSAESKAQANTPFSQAPNPQAVVVDSTPGIKPLLEVATMAPGAVTTPSGEVSETRAPQQEVPVKHTEAPNLRTAGDFTIRSVRHLLGSGEESIEVKLYPRSLGSLKVDVKTTGEAVEIIVTAASPMVREMLEVQLVGLKESLMNDGVEVTKVKVESNAASQQDTANLASQHQSTSSQGTSKQQNTAQQTLGGYQDEGQDSGEPSPQSAQEPGYHEGEINLFA